MNAEQDKFKELKWKSGVLAPTDAKRPRCRVIESLNGVNGKIVEDKTDLIDWLIVIAYETEEKNESKNIRRPRKI